MVAVYGTRENSVLALAAPGVLGNDMDAEDQSLGAVLVAGPSNGPLTLYADGSLPARAWFSPSNRDRAALDQYQLGDHVP